VCRVFLLPHQRLRHAGRRAGAVGQRSLCAGAADRPAEERGARPADAGRHAGEQLGVHGDGVPGMDAQGLVRTAAAGAGPVGGAVRGGEAGGAQDGVPHVPAGVHRDAVPDHPSRTADRLSAADVESVAAGVAPRGRRSSAAAALLTETHPGGVGAETNGNHSVHQRRSAKAGQSQPEQESTAGTAGGRSVPLRIGSSIPTAAMKPRLFEG